MKQSFFLAMMFLSQLIFSQNSLIPKPQKIEVFPGNNFQIDAKTSIVGNEKSFEYQFLLKQIKSKTNLDLSKNKAIKGANAIFLSTLTQDKKADPTFNKKNDYQINVNKDFIALKGKDSGGLFQAIQTFLQLVDEHSANLKIPTLKIEDFPKFSWRGMHLDCSRHFFTVDEVKKYIDYSAMYKMNTFHWHLTDDQGWRIEIKKYPKLTEVGAWRNGSMVGHYNEQKFDNERYGGFYTQEEVKDIVKYAQDRHITVIPEIEMPGHSVAAIASYPWLGCTGKQIEVAKKWGVLDDVLCPNEETFKFLEDVLTEVMALFPSKIIHIGGDECPKTQWKESAFCQDLIKKLNLKDEHELQSYFIQRMEKFLNSKGRKIIGWDEILEGGLAPNAAVMSWRGTEGGIAAAKEKHDVVMTPVSYCYFDYYQGDKQNEPLSIGGFIPIEKVYGYNPIPKELNKEEAKYILGAQGNLWTEYIKDFKHVEYMIFPRITALSEVLWGTSESENLPQFSQRLFKHMKVWDKLGINYSKAIYNVNIVLVSDKDKNQIKITLNSSINPENIRYTLDGTTPTENSFKYKNPILVDKTTFLKAAYFENGVLKSSIAEQTILFSKSTGKSVVLKEEPAENYKTNANLVLVDGIKGLPLDFGRDWVGFLGKDFDATVDLGKTENISKFSISAMNANGSWIYLPTKFELSVSTDGKTYKTISEFNADEITQKNGVFDLKFQPVQAKFVKVSMKNLGKIPMGKEGAGTPAWLFVDEIMID